MKIVLLSGPKVPDVYPIAIDKLVLAVPFFYNRLYRSSRTTRDEHQECCRLTDAQNEHATFGCQLPRCQNEGQTTRQMTLANSRKLLMKKQPNIFKILIYLHNNSVSG